MAILLRFSVFLSILLCCTSAMPPKAVTWTMDKKYDFGNIAFGSVHGTVFTFKNTSDAPVLLQTVRTTCGCTAAQWPEAAIAPGATGDIRIEYSADKSGRFSKKIKVFFDAMRKPEILRIEGMVE